MRIQFSPIRHETPLTASLAGEVLTLNGAEIDLSTIPEAGSLSPEALACDWLVADVTRSAGVLHLTLLLPHGANAPDETRFPAPLDVTGDGPISLPPYDAPNEAFPDLGMPADMEPDMAPDMTPGIDLPG